MSLSFIGTGEDKIDEKMEEKTIDDDETDGSATSLVLSPVAVPSQKSIVVGGRICCDEGEHLIDVK